ncbi:ATP-grasp domain-containing protein [Bradymonadaceae bacterium TMQ3]|uniref:ATP-grasp domain-containing protein n=1 Tax=Lujinxingia sediminis TaxID=2480984 RepID=A0ABY0CWT9_9DELT|nr:ATP-grasp domain-containing protein [Lujinxingia sediminis]RDV39591.1 ATP-grasp domain-containing protein [Bradymonadaceae bacterium TMQ3]RVU48363.1 ATP-grasp domain-containing protein [Lujinxingia sediminis]TXC77665.1 ATP-grasp domain-containing protein [Bradymonadales bacterium TMQ1]
MNLVMIGFRRDAHEAALTRGWRAHFLVDSTRQPPRSGVSWASVDLNGDVESWEKAARRLAGDATIDAVIASGESSVVPAALLRERLGVSGMSVATARRCHDKIWMKDALTAAGVPCARYLTITPSTGVDDLIEALGLPLVIKAPDSSGGRGTHICESSAQVEAALRPGLLAEAFVPGTEFSVESFVHRGQVCFLNVTSYLRPGWANIVPADLPAERITTIATLNRQTIAALGVDQGMTHMEFFASESGDVVGELAARPPGGALMELIGEAYGFDAWQAFLDIETGRLPRFPSGLRRFEGVYFLHPGGGRVTAVRGLRRSRQLAHVSAVSCRVQPGDTIEERVGVGQSVGRIRAGASDYASVARALLEAHRCVEIELAPAQSVPTSPEPSHDSGG